MMLKRTQLKDTYPPIKMEELQYADRCSRAFARFEGKLLSKLINGELTQKDIEFYHTVLLQQNLTDSLFFYELDKQLKQKK